MAYGGPVSVASMLTVCVPYTEPKSACAVAATKPVNAGNRHLQANAHPVPACGMVPHLRMPCNRARAACAPGSTCRRPALLHRLVRLPEGRTRKNDTPVEHLSVTSSHFPDLSAEAQHTEQHHHGHEQVPVLRT